MADDGRDQLITSAMAIRMLMCHERWKQYVLSAKKGGTGRREYNGNSSRKDHPYGHCDACRCHVRESLFSCSSHKALLVRRTKPSTDESGEGT